MSKEFECRREVVLPVDPDRVWEAVSTPEGLLAWQFPSPIDSIRDVATVWDEPHHLSVRMEQGDWFNALEYVIEGRSGGTSVLRYMHSGIFTDDWDAQYDAVQQHTDFYLHTLGQYLEFFDGIPATYIGDVPGGLQGPPRSAEPDGFDRMKRALGLADDIAPGDKVEFGAGRARSRGRSHRLSTAQLLGHPHPVRPVSVLRPECVRIAGRHDDPHLRTCRRRGGHQGRLAGVARRFLGLIGRGRSPLRPARAQGAMVSSADTSESERTNAAAATFSWRCATDEVPGMSRMFGDRWSSQAKATAMGGAPTRAATDSSVSDCSGENPPSGK